MPEKFQECQERMQILEDAEKIPLLDDTSNEKCTQRSIRLGRVRVVFDFSLPIQFSYPPANLASIQLPDLDERISVSYPCEVFFAVANCQREEKVNAEYRISVNRQLGYMRYYYFADVPDVDYKLKPTLVVLLLATVCRLFIK
ncbi:uncharacterized protein LOC134850908 [Symsagittifera roscoffensis]|uniref:uncharacterized protein LOC134850908 n=1 Tax=Symsagittifera roscoffensis TaxID=84072 RepID=UPI00307C8CDF